MARSISRPTGSGLATILLLALHATGLAVGPAAAQDEEPLVTANWFLALTGAVVISLLVFRTKTEAHGAVPPPPVGLGQVPGILASPHHLVVRRAVVEWCAAPERR